MITPDKFHDECAVFGIYGHKEAANLTYLGLYALQHRGQEASGIVSGDGEQFHVHKGMGLVADIYNTQALDAINWFDGDRSQSLLHGRGERSQERPAVLGQLCVWESGACP